jgi:hypothetical protein
LVFSQKRKVELDVQHTYTHPCTCLRLCCAPPPLGCPCCLQWTAPEVRAGSEASGRVVTTASDVYMVGGLTYELLTAGTPPFHWLAGNTQLLVQRLTSAGPVEIPDTDVEVPGLLHKSVLEAAELSRKPIPWCVRADATPGSGQRLEEVKGLMTACLALSPKDRPMLAALHSSVAGLLGAEVAEVRAWAPPRPHAEASGPYCGSQQYPGQQ